MATCWMRPCMQPSLQARAMWPVRSASRKAAQRHLQLLQRPQLHQRLHQVTLLTRYIYVTVLHICS